MNDFIISSAHIHNSDTTELQQCQDFEELHLSSRRCEQNVMIWYTTQPLYRHSVRVNARHIHPATLHLLIVILTDHFPFPFLFTSSRPQIQTSRHNTKNVYTFMHPHLSLSSFLNFLTLSNTPISPSLSLLFS